MSTITQATSYTKIKQPSDHDSRNFGPLVHGYEAQVSTAAQTIINLTQFVCDLANKSQIMVYVDGNLLTEGVGNDYVWVTGLNNTSSQLTLATSISAGLNIQLYKIGAPRVSLPTADSINATINLVQTDSDNQSQQYMINGAFDFWQEATSFAAIANGTYFADQWEYVKVGSMVHTVSRSANFPGFMSGYSALVDCTTVDAAIAAGDYCAVRQKIEGNVLKTFKGKNLVFAFDVVSPKAGIHCVSFSNSAGTMSIVKEFTVTSANVRERIYVRFNHDVTGAWNYDTSIGMVAYFPLAAGTTFQTTPGTWQNGNFIATANQQNLCDSTANDFYITDVVLTTDNASLNKMPAAKYFNGSYSAEEELILRYFEFIAHGGGSADVSFPGRNSATTTNRATWLFKVQKRVAAAATFSGTIGNVLVTSSSSFTASAISGLTASTSYAIIQTTIAGATLGTVGNLVFTGTDNRLSLNARM